MNKIIFLFLLLLPSIGFAQEVLIPQEKDGKWGYISFDTKTVIVPYQYDVAEKYSSSGTAKVKTGDKWGLLDAYGKELLPLIYDYIYIENSVHRFILNGKWGIFDTDFNVVISPQYEMLHRFGRYYNVYETGIHHQFEKKWLQYFKCKKNGKWGVIDINNQVILSFKYDDIAYIKESSFYFFNRSIPKSTRLYISGPRGYCGTQDFAPVTENFFLVKTGDQSQIITSKEKIIYTIDGYQTVPANVRSSEKLYTSTDEKLEDGIFIINQNGKIGGVSTKGKLIFPFEYEDILYRSNNIFHIKKQGKYGVANSAGDILCQPKYDQIYGHLAILNGKQGILNPDFNSLLFPIEYDKIENVDNNSYGFIHIKQANQEGLLDKNGKVLLPLDYQTIQSSAYGMEYFIVQKDNLWSILDCEMNELLETKYDNITESPREKILLLIKKDNQFGVWHSRKKEWLVPLTYDSINVLSEDEFLVQKNNKWGVYHTEYEFVVKLKYDEIKQYKGRIGNKWETLKYYKGQQEHLDKKNKNQKGINQQGDKYGVTDKDGNWLLSPKYQKVIERDNCYQMVQDGKVGIIERSGQFIIEPQYEEIIYHKKKNFIKAKQNGKWGMINQQNEILIPFKYTRIEALRKDKIKIYDGKNCKLVNEKGQEISSASYTKISYLDFYPNPTPSLNLLKVSQVYRVGIIDDNGNSILPCKFQSIRPQISEIKPSKFPKLFPVKLNEKWGFAKKGGEIVVPCQFDKVSYFDKGVAFIQKENKYFLINDKGNILTRKGYTTIKSFDVYSELSIVTNEERKFGAINLKGEETIPVIYDEVQQYNRRAYAVKLKNKYGIINQEGKIIIPIKSEVIPPGTILGLQISSYKVNLKGSLGERLLSKSFENSYQYYKNYFVVEKNKKVGLIDILTEQLVLPIEYDKISGTFKQCSMDYFVVQKGEQFGLVDKSNRSIFPIEYNNISILPHLKLAIIKKDGKTALGNLAGKFITPFEYEEIPRNNFSPFPAKKNGKWGYIDNKGKVIYPFELDQAIRFYTYYNNQTIIIPNSPCNPSSLPDSVQLKTYIQIGENTFWLSADGRVTKIPKDNYNRIELLDNIFVEYNTDNYNDYKRFLVNQNGEKILPHSFSSIYSYCNGFIPFSMNGGKSGFYFPQLKKEVIYNGVQINNHDNASIRWVREKREYGFINNEGKEITPIHFERVGHTREGMISVLKDGKMGFLNELGELKIPMKFDDDGRYSPQFEKGIAYAYLDGKYGFIDTTGKTVEPFEFEAIAYFKDGVAIAYRNGKWEELNF